MSRRASTLSPCASKTSTITRPRPKRSSHSPMRLLLCCLPLLAVAFAAEWKVDHATIAGPSLKHLRELLDAAGLRTEYGGEHSSRLTEMAVMSFADGSYLELIAWVNAAAPHPGQ